MPFKQFRDNYYEGLGWPSVVKPVRAVITTTGAATLWTPASGKKFRLLGGQLTIHIGVVTAGGAAGDFILLYDNAITAGIRNLGVFPDAALVAGSVFGTSIVGDTAWDATADSLLGGNTVQHVQEFFIPGGYLASAADNVLKAQVAALADGTAVDISTGKIWFSGVVFGHEE